jgi:hypothetical protein
LGLDVQSAGASVVTRDEARLALWSAVQLLVVNADKVGRRLVDAKSARSLVTLFPEAGMSVEEVKRELKRFGDALARRHKDDASG